VGFQARPSTFPAIQTLRLQTSPRAYIECTINDTLKPSQVEWFTAALRETIVAPADVLVIQGVHKV
jgi:hypothetical protein